jgi:putative component of membrane protein insertase Oxa1/YidC/SpoIIIJ protein YidD
MVVTIIIITLIAGQTESIQEDLRFITRVNPAYTQPSREREDLDFNFRQTNELRLAFTGMIRLYQIFVSPQGPPACNFTVTCSQFLSRAVRKYGFIHGVLMGADRLTRCTHSTRRLYEIDDVTGKAIDYPVEAYYLFSRPRIVRTVSYTSSSPTGGEELKEGGSQ